MLTTSLPGGARVLLLPDTRFASIQIKLGYATPLRTEKITPAALLPLLLKRGSNKTPSQQELALALEKLWGAEIQAGVAKLGSAHLTLFELDITDPRFLPLSAAEILSEGVRLLADLVQDPLLPQGSFDSDVFREEQQILLSTQQRLKNSRGAYAMDRCLNALYAGGAQGINRIGIAEELQKLTPELLTSYYSYFRQNAQLVIGVTGAFEPEEMLQILSRNFNSHPEAALQLDHQPKGYAAAEQRIREDLPGEQSQLILAFCSEIGYQDELSLPLTLANGLLGAYAHSRLFRYLREEAGLAYSAWSRIDRTQGTLFAGAGISAEDAPQAEEIVLRELSSLQRGEIAEEEWQMTLLTLQDQYRQLSDEPNSMLDFYFNSELLQRRLSLEETMAAITKITREQVVAAAQRLKLHTSFLLAGDDSEDVESEEEEDV